MRQVVVTDTQRHWAASWIAETASAGIIEPFENHTFQPGTPVRRGDLATVVSRLLSVIASSNPSVRERLANRPGVAVAVAEPPLGTAHARQPTEPQQAGKTGPQILL